MEEFVLVGPNKDKTMVINGRYEFKDGVLQVADRDMADKLEPILCGYFSCKRRTVKAEAKADEKRDANSLSAESTKK